MRRLLWVSGIFLLCCSCAAHAQNYKVSGIIPIEGDGGWDALLADPTSGQLFVSHGTEVAVIDLATEKPTAKIAGMKRIRGIAVADDLGRGFISDGGDDAVIIFDLESHTVLQKVQAGKNPDGLLYDAFSKRVFAFNTGSKDVTVIDAATGKVAGTIPVDGWPEFPASDGKGNVYVNIWDKSELSQIDPQAMKVRNTWPLAPCDEPFGLAIDPDGRRLFSVCDNKLMAVTDADSGKVVTTVAIGNGPDGAGYDPGIHVVFSSNGEGTLTVVKQESADKYTVLANVPTESSARTMTLDPKTHKVYLSAAQMRGPPQAVTPDNPRGLPKMVPGTFHLVVVSPQ